MAIVDCWAMWRSAGTAAHYQRRRYHRNRTIGIRAPAWHANILAAQDLWSRLHPADKNFWQTHFIEGPGQALPEQ